MTKCGHAFCGGCIYETLKSQPKAIVGDNSPWRREGSAAMFLPRSRGISSHGGAGTPSLLRGMGILRFSTNSAVSTSGSGSGNVANVENPESKIPPPTGELDGTCPVCRTNLRGGWGRALRGIKIRMGRGTGLNNNDFDDRVEDGK
jgi:hypothetical protein